MEIFLNELDLMTHWHMTNGITGALVVMDTQDKQHIEHSHIRLLSMQGYVNIKILNSVIFWEGPTGYWSYAPCCIAPIHCGCQLVFSSPLFWFLSMREKQIEPAEAVVFKCYFITAFMKWGRKSEVWCFFCCSELVLIFIVVCLIIHEIKCPTLQLYFIIGW